jgi:hypothetical protein
MRGSMRCERAGLSENKQCTIIQIAACFVVVKMRRRCSASHAVDEAVAGRGGGCVYFGTALRFNVKGC